MFSEQWNDEINKPNDILAYLTGNPPFFPPQPPPVLPERATGVRDAQKAGQYVVVNRAKYSVKEHQISAKQLSADSSSIETLYCLNRKCQRQRRVSGNGWI